MQASPAWSELYWYAKAGAFLFCGGWVARHYLHRFTESMREFMRSMIAELIKSTNTQFAYRDEQIRSINREVQRQKHRITALSLANVEFSTSLLFPGDSSELNRHERIRMIDHFRNIATQTSIESEDFQKIDEED